MAVVVTPLMLEQDIISVAQYVLVVEKESVFQRLANDQFCKRNRCIVITGRGYPDVPTRRFLCLLIDKLHLPVYCLQMAYDATYLRVSEIQWLGVFVQDCNNYSIPQQCLLPLTAEDKRKVEAMLPRCYLQREVPKWRFELELLLHKGVKFEIEALSVHSLTFLSHEYLPSKIHSGGYI
ncbi:meiotic recombination protein SPO11-1-like [Lycium barbarum]|uniref:meiotic recombination protein SPO11-1-like n=1 Tax=Lycium barbarum TaxID=112863 RepID=UPI00293F4C2C|nr:meiotic recombination protein SPO11-1-like [Lycium barbarum]